MHLKQLFDKRVCGRAVFADGAGLTPPGPAAGIRLHLKLSRGDITFSELNEKYSRLERTGLLLLFI